VDGQVVRRAQGGDSTAFDEIAAALADQFYAVAYRILRSQPHAEDAAQQALVAVWREMPRLRDPERFDAWAYRLLVNAAYGEFRRRRRDATPASLDDQLPETDPYPTIHDRDQLERGFNRLSAPQRTVLVLQHYLNLSHDEMAQVLDIPVGTVRSRLHLARSAMRAALEADARPARKGSLA
jgi:RNA polymerase sigma-70 factor (ECF subfamily)